MNRPLALTAHYFADSGLEAMLVAADERARPVWATFVLIDEVTGKERLRAHYRQQADVAAAHGMGFIFEAPTWRANSDWGDEVGYSEAELERINREAIALCRDVQRGYPHIPTLVAGQLGPRNADYNPQERMTADEAAIYHRPQIRAFKEASADLVTALGINDVDEAVGIAIAARCLRIPCVISFTCGADGRLPSGQALGAAVDEVDDRTGGSVAYFTVDCANPTQFVARLDALCADRVAGIRASRSPGAAANIETLAPLRSGDPITLAADYCALRAMLPTLRIYGGGYAAATPRGKPLPENLRALVRCAAA